MGKTAYNCFARFYYGYVLNVDKLWFGNGLEIFFELAQTLYSKIKICSTFLKVVGVGKAHKAFNQSPIAKQPAVWRLEHNSESLLLAIAIRKTINYIMKN